MERDTLGLADGSLFIEKIKHTFKSADADMLIRAHCFYLEKACGPDAIGYKAADLLLEQGADEITIAAALLAPLIWQNLTNHGDIRDHFGTEVATTLQDLNSRPYSRTDLCRYQREDIHTLLASMGDVPRKYLLFIVFRLLTLKPATVSNEAEARKIAQETLDLLVPIADRLSLDDLRRQLEDACFQILDPQGYVCLRGKVTPIQAEDDKCLQILLAGVQRLLRNNNIQGRVQGRTKSLHGIRRKMVQTGKTLEEIMDRVGLRVILTSVLECYTVLGLLHAHFKPIPGTFDDYIGLPKENGYQSLHTCAYPVREISHKPIEFQVRTELMHAEAEYGTTAHWRYKSEVETKKHNHQQVQWIKGLARQHEEADSTKAFIQLLQRQVSRDHLVVFGNGGRIVRMADKATVLDYLKITNTQVPQGTVVKVNGNIANLDQPLQDGDSIAVLSSGVSSGLQFAENSLQYMPSRIAGRFSSGYEI